MNYKTEHIEQISQTEMEMMPGLTYRGFRGEVDFPGMLAVLHGCAAADGLERAEQMEDIANTYAHLHNCDPTTDMLFAEIDGKVIGYSRIWWSVEGSGQWIGFQFGNVMPAWRGKGIGSKLLKFNEERLAQIATLLKANGQLLVEAACLLDNFVSNTEIDRMNLLERRGYRAARYAFEMVRPDLENIPDLSLPAGVEVRAVKPEHLRLIWEASNEAFRDHWGYIPDPWEEFERIVNDPDHDPSLWRVAWQGDQVVGMVLNFIDKDQNEIYRRKRGYTENICVRRPWRKQGVAKALIALSLVVLKERGMTEAGLGVDAENISGALHLYESMGYQVVKKSTIYRKQMNV
ncbi:MAG: GNAT family N-acetyltransferase [Anaerolineales bacterium]